MAGPDALLIAPAGLGWLPGVLGIVKPWLGVVDAALRVSAGLGLLGVATRVSLSVCALCFVLLFGGAQLSGTVLHDMHLLWLLLLLIVGPSGATLSVDALYKRRGLWGPAPSGAASVTLFFARLLLGFVYLFPGIEKLRISGLDWALSDNLANQMRMKWFMAGGDLPWPRIDLHPGWLHTLGLLTLLFECSFVVLVLFRRGRWLGACMGACFHAGAQHFLYIPFPSLWLCYVVLWDGLPVRQLREPVPLRTVLGPLLVGSGLALAVLVQGVRGVTQAWPFACYPSFADRVAPTISDLAIAVEYPAGISRVWRPQRVRSNQEWGAVWRMLGLYDGKVVPTALEAYARKLAHAHGEPALEAGSKLRFYVEVFSTDPERRNAPALRHELRYTSQVK
jgi:hypothetical protein